MKWICAFGMAVAAPGLAQAQDVKIVPSADVRLRYEHVDQDGIADSADALTLRVRPGITASWKGLSALVEGEGVIALGNDYNDGTNGKTRYPLVGDPENIEINRAQLRYAGADGLAATAGRQRLALADERFVGTAPWRQSEQTFDALRFQWGKAAGLNIDLSYSASVRTTSGRNGTGARPTAIDGDNVFAIVGYATKPVTISGFAYLVDQDEAAVEGYRLSSQTYGVRLQGKTPLQRDTTLCYILSWARQSDWHRNPNDYAASYWLGEASVAGKALSATAGYEILGTDRGLALTSVQTPLGALFRFGGWAGKFGTTPPDGLRDLYGTLGYAAKKVGPIDALGFTVALHRFGSDRIVRHYGNEIDLLATAKLGKFLLSARYAHYEADRFATDTDKAWLQLDWTL